MSAKVQVQQSTTSEREVTRLELEQQLPVSLAIRTELAHCIAQMADELALALKSALYIKRPKRIPWRQHMPAGPELCDSCGYLSHL
jgi:hypothetical protein